MRKFSTLVLVSLIGLAGIGAVALRNRQLHPVGPMHTASTHPMQYYLSLPRDWSNAREWPVVIAVAGSDHRWENHLKIFADARDAHRYPFILVSPVILTNGGGDLRTNRHYNYDESTFALVDHEGRCAFDFDGLAAILADVRKTYRGSSKYFISGFSGGGPLAEAMAFFHPESLRGAAFSAANYNSRCVTKPTGAPGDTLTPQVISSDPSRTTLPLRWFNGADDRVSHILIPQRDEAMSVAKNHGFENLTDSIVPGTLHEPMAGQVLDFFASLLGPNER